MAIFVTYNYMECIFCISNFSQMDWRQWKLAKCVHVEHGPSAGFDFTNVTSADYVHVDYAVEIAQLSFSGGMLELTGNTTFNVSGNLAFDRGYIECAQPSFQNLSLTNMYVGGSTNMSSSERKYLRYVTIHQLREEMLWTGGGLLTLTNATIHIYPAANFTVTVQTTTTNNASSGEYSLSITLSFSLLIYLL